MNIRTEANEVLVTMYYDEFDYLVVELSADFGCEMVSEIRISYN